VVFPAFLIFPAAARQQVSYFEALTQVIISFFASTVSEQIIGGDAYILRENL